MMNYPTMSGPMDVRKESEDVGQHQEVQAAANVHWPTPSSMPATNPPQPHQPLQLPSTSSQMTWDQFQLQFPIPEELIRIPDGSSISEPDAVLAENGRTYHGYKEGKYFLPNDAVRVDCPWKTWDRILAYRLHRQNKTGWTFNIKCLSWPWTADWPLLP